jgi:hypothetical protein
MIRDLLVQERVLAKLAAGKVATRKAASALRKRDDAAMNLSEKFQIAPEQLSYLLSALDEAIESTKKQESDGAFMPRDPKSAILQSALEQF